MTPSETRRPERAGTTPKAVRRPIPGEHGAWGALLTAIAVGTALAVRAGGSLWLALGAGAAAVDLFMLREALFQAYRPQRARDPGRRAAEQAEMLRARRWVQGELLVLAIVGLLLIGATGQTWLLPVGAVGLAFLAAFVLLRRSRRERGFWAEVVGFVGMSAAGPVAYLLALSATVSPGVARSAGGLLSAPSVGGVLPTLLAEAVLLWLLLALYFVGPVYYVRMKVAQQRERPASWAGRLRLGWGTLLYSAGVAGFLAWTGVWASLGPWPLLAYAPSLIKNAVGVFRVRLPLNLRRIGFTEVGLSLLFALGLYLGLG